MMATRLSVDPETVQNLMTQTLMKAKGGQQQVTHEELMVFMSIANEYRLNPLTKEIYAFNNRGAIQPIVSIDGWLRIINGHSQFDGMEFDDKLNDQGGLLAITCRIYRKDRSRATEVTEYLEECKGTSEPWKKWPVRMLRHKATIQCARYAFGLSGIIDEDEAERYKATNLERDVTPQQSQREALEYYSDSDFEKNFPAWQGLIESGKKTPDQIISMVSSKALLTDEQEKKIREVQA
ncbi:recombinase RecT [Chromohalobacter salexigens]|nr:recombinase RecT [Chromohalobacter salexigens]